MEKLRRLVNEIAYTPRSQSLSPVHLPLIPLLSLSSSLYNLLLSLRHHLYRFLPHRRLPVPVISVGNLTWGGNGKTPMVEFVALLFDSYGISPLILTRGYGGGDEAKMLARHLGGTSAKIGVGANRAATAMPFFLRHGYILPHQIAGFEKTHSFQVAGSDVISDKIGVAILDDGMQHISLCRDLEIVMVNGLKPWGNHRLIPFGPLREPLTALCRADAVVIHHADLVSENDLRVIETSIQEVNEFLPIYHSGMVPSHFFEVGKISSRLPLEVVHNLTILCVSAIGSADSFVQRIERMRPFYVDRLDYSDHHRFQNKDVDTITARLLKLQTQFASMPTVVVTEKVRYYVHDLIDAHFHNLNLVIKHSARYLIILVQLHRDRDIYILPPFMKQYESVLFHLRSHWTSLSLEFVRQQTGKGCVAWVIIYGGTAFLIFSQLWSNFHTSIHPRLSL